MCGGLYKYRTIHEAFAYDHTTLNIPVLVRIPKSSSVGPMVSTWWETSWECRVLYRLLFYFIFSTRNITNQTLFLISLFYFTVFPIVFLFKISFLSKVFLHEKMIMTSKLSDNTKSFDQDTENPMKCTRNSMYLNDCLYFHSFPIAGTQVMKERARMRTCLFSTPRLH